MKVCFYHQQFDTDVSSGTEHSAHQWHELCMAFNVTKIAVINETNSKYLKVSDSIELLEFDTLEDFLNTEEGHKVFIETNGNTEYKDYKFNKEDWVIFGGTGGLPEGNVKIDTNGVVLYPREVAAIILSEAKWQLR